MDGSPKISNHLLINGGRALLLWLRFVPVVPGRARDLLRVRVYPHVLGLVLDRRSRGFRLRAQRLRGRHTFAGWARNHSHPQKNIFPSHVRLRRWPLSRNLLLFPIQRAFQCADQIFPTPDQV